MHQYGMYILNQMPLWQLIDLINTIDMQLIIEDGEIKEYQI